MMKRSGGFLASKPKIRRSLGFSVDQNKSEWGSCGDGFEGISSSESHGGNKPKKRQSTGGTVKLQVQHVQPEVQNCSTSSRSQEDQIQWTSSDTSDDEGQEQHRPNVSALTCRPTGASNRYIRLQSLKPAKVNSKSLPQKGQQCTLSRTSVKTVTNACKPIPLPQLEDIEDLNLTTITKTLNETKEAGQELDCLEASEPVASTASISDFDSESESNIDINEKETSDQDLLDKRELSDCKTESISRSTTPSQASINSFPSPTHDDDSGEEPQSTRLDSSRTTFTCNHGDIIGNNSDRSSVKLIPKTPKRNESQKHGSEYQDSAKKQKHYKSGLAGRLQRILQREKTESIFRSHKQSSGDSQDSSQKMKLRIISSTVVGGVQVCHCYKEDEQYAQAVLHSTVPLPNTGCKVNLNPPWQKLGLNRHDVMLIPGTSLSLSGSQTPDETYNISEHWEVVATMQH